VSKSLSLTPKEFSSFQRAVGMAFLFEHNSSHSRVFNRDDLRVNHAKHETLPELWPHSCKQVVGIFEKEVVMNPFE
jgi:hypothetical protein